MLKAANVGLVGPMTQVGNALVTAVVVGIAGFEVWFFFFSGSPIG